MLSPSVPDGVSLLCLSKPAGRASFSPPVIFQPFLHTATPFLFFIPSRSFPVCTRNCIGRLLVYCLHFSPLFISFRRPDLYFHPTSADSSPSLRLHPSSLYHFSSSLRSASMSAGVKEGCVGLVAIGIDSDRGQGWFIYSAHEVSSLTNSLYAIDRCSVK